MKRSRPVAAALQTEADIRAALRAQLDGTRQTKAALADRLGIRNQQLSAVLRGTWPVPDGVAAALGLRRVARFEPIDG